MVWLTGLLTTILVLSADLAAQKPVEHVGTHTLVGLIFLLMAPAFAVVQSFVTTRRWADREILEHRAEFLHRSLLGSNLIIWLFGCVALLMIAKWPQLIRENWNLNQVPLLDELALAIPMIGSIMLSWFVIFDAEKAIREAKTIEGAQTTQRNQRTRLAIQRFRTFAGLILVPIALLFLYRDLMAMIYPEGIGPVGTCLAFVILLVVLLSLYPLLLSWTWKTREVECPSLSLRLAQVGREAGLPNERFRIWDTDSTITNAVVVGVIPGLRRVFISDQLLERFDQDEVLAIYRHELGHLVYRHLHMRLAMFLVPLLALGAFAASSGNYGQAQDYNATALQASIWMLCVVAFLLYATRIVARFVRKSEVQADLFAICRDNGRVCLRRANVYCQALLKMAAVSPELFERSTTVHPSIKLRIAVIQQVIDRPERMDEFHRRFLQEQQIAAGCLVALVTFSFLAGNLI